MPCPYGRKAKKMDANSTKPAIELLQVERKYETFEYFHNAVLRPCLADEQRIALFEEMEVAESEGRINWLHEIRPDIDADGSQYAQFLWYADTDQTQWFREIFEKVIHAG